MDNNKLVGETDAAVWAHEFVKTVRKHPELPTDEGAMIGWFANAIQTGHDSHPIERQRHKDAIESAMYREVLEARGLAEQEWQ